MWKHLKISIGDRDTGITTGAIAYSPLSKWVEVDEKKIKLFSHPNSWPLDSVFGLLGGLCTKDPFLKGPRSLHVKEYLPIIWYSEAKPRFGLDVQ